MIRKLMDDLAGAPRADPVEAARRAMRPPLPKRFYKAVTVTEEGGAYRVQLDGKTARTPARHALALSTRALADAVAEEWSAQEAELDPARMPLTRLANVAIDRVGPEADAIREDVMRYAASDLLCYRAGRPAALAALQAAAWDPILAWAREALGARFVLTVGVRFAQQPADATAAIRRELARYPAPFALAAVANATTLSGSVLLAMALARGRLAAADAWAAAHVDEDWNIRQWGEDPEAARRRAARFNEFKACARMLELAG